MWIFEWVFGFFGSGESASEGPFTKTNLKHSDTFTKTQQVPTFTKTQQVPPYSRTTQRIRR